jgi:branched-chain amino acid transport system substrate-binding protein
MVSPGKWEQLPMTMKIKLFFIFLFYLFSILFQNLPANAFDPSPIRIGATVSLEGQYQEPSVMIQKAFQLWEQEVNQNGGLLGRPVELILYNDKSQKELVKKLYRKLIEEDRVDFVFSPYGTLLTLAASEISEHHKLIMLACAASGEIIWNRGFKYVFGVYALANRYFIGLLDLMARKGYNTVSLIYNDTSPFNIDVAEGVKKWAENFKITVAHEKRYQDGSNELPEILSELKASKAKHLILSAYPPDGYLLLHLMQKNEYRPDILAMTIAPIHPDFYQKAGAMGDRVFGPSQWEPSERIPFPGTKEFIQAFIQFSKKFPSYHAGSAYAACQLYAEAIRKCQSLDNEKSREYIAALDTVTVIGRFKVDVSGKQIGHNPIIIQWQNGKKEIVWPPKMQTAPPLF